MTVFITALLIALFKIFVLGVSWIATCGLVKLITLCFGWAFSWPVATGVWLIWLALSTIFKK